MILEGVTKAVVLVLLEIRRGFYFFICFGARRVRRSERWAWNSTLEGVAAGVPMVTTRS
jgi:hypothetical protein